MSKTDYFGDPDAPKANSLVVAVAAVVRNDRGEVLLIERTDNGLWALPGGALEIGESVKDAVIREVPEETGLDVEVTALTGVYSDPAHVMPMMAAKSVRNSHCASQRGRYRARCGLAPNPGSEMGCARRDRRPEHPSLDAATHRAWA